ncbi:MAG: class II fructose-bisphosphate aldolase [Planctomycetia bacterium]|nr:class II fructose-bisphosphate aldolase [Planctomycetia bacterium]
MPLVDTVTMMTAVRARGGCVGAFNVVDFLSIEAVVAASERSGCPAIIQASSGTLKAFGVPCLTKMVKLAAERSTHPLALHLDHGTDPNIIREAVRCGFNSVMIDASSFPIDENVRRTKEIVDYAHDYGVTVEGEIGVVAGVEDDVVVNEDAAIYTTPAEALDFLARTGVDFLAAAIGTAHGFYKSKPRLNIQTLRDLYARTSCPLVVHGGTGLDRDTVAELVRAGASKFNVSTQIKIDYIDSLYKYIDEHRTEYNILKVLARAKSDLVDMLADYMTLLSKGE